MDGDGDGKVAAPEPRRLGRDAGPDDLGQRAACAPGIFQHNHASWYVEEVLDEAEPLAGKCRVRTVAYSIALPGPDRGPDQLGERRALQLARALGPRSRA